MISFITNGFHRSIQTCCHLNIGIITRKLPKVLGVKIKDVPEQQNQSRLFLRIQSDSRISVANTNISKCLNENYMIGPISKVCNDYLYKYWVSLTYI